ncbi:hypothetical protein N7454_006989 [Penicillium verhagenii]|nr:hypothetical protein N7454_006989 [Penicillium verhagenii]
MISYLRIKKRDPNAAALLLLLARFDNRDIWYELVESGHHSSNVPDCLKDTISSELAFKIDWSDDSIELLGALYGLGDLYSDQGKLKEAEKMYQQALAGKEKALGPDHISTLDTVSNLGSLYSEQDKLEEAEELYQRAMAGKKKTLVPDHDRTR